MMPIHYLFLIAMLFFHIIDDFYLQGCLAKLKRRDYWEENYPDDMYKRDHFTALIIHAFSWTVMVHIPALVYSIKFAGALPAYWFLFFVLHWAIHTITDHMKANLNVISLSYDQLVHALQVVFIWLYWVASR